MGTSTALRRTKGVNHVAPGRIITMDRHRVNADAPLKPAASPRAGVLVLRHGPSAVLWLDHGRCRRRPPVARVAPDRAPTAARVVLCGSGQERAPAPGPRCAPLLWPLAPLGACVVGA